MLEGGLEMGAAKAGNRTVPLTAHSNYGGSHRVDSSACNYFVYLNLNYLNSPNGLEAPSEFEMPVPKRCHHLPHYALQAGGQDR